LKINSVFAQLVCGILKVGVIFINLTDDKILTAKSGQEISNKEKGGKDVFG
jgi:hypothetical protein